MIKLGVSLLLLVTLSTPSFCQQKTKPKAQPPAPIVEQKPAPDVLPPYETDLLKLATTLGSLSLLSSVCTSDNSTSAAIWRSKAEELLKSEGASEHRKKLFIASFNQGFNSYLEVYHICTSNAELAKERLLKDGAKLGRELSSRFGN